MQVSVCLKLWGLTSMNLGIFNFYFSVHVNSVVWEGVGAACVGVGTIAIIRLGGFYR